MSIKRNALTRLQANAVAAYIRDRFEAYRDEEYTIQQAADEAATALGYAVTHSNVQSIINDEPHLRWFPLPGERKPADVKALERTIERQAQLIEELVARVARLEARTARDPMQPALPWPRGEVPMSHADVA